MKKALGITCLLLAVAAASGASVRTTAADEDLITDLPGIDISSLNYDQYSGYLDAGDGDMLHYWFTESQKDPDNDPVILWMNGGPGCSSLDGFLSELGPLHVNDDGETLYVNEYSWNTFANVIFLESPACVGFSYGADMSYCEANDDYTAEHNYNALVDFFAKFPEFLANDFYVTGESYAGVYVPTLTWQIINNQDGNNDINLQGFAVGNGITDWSMNSESLLFFGNYHGILDQDLWNNVTQTCCDDGLISKDTCKLTNSDDSGSCALWAADAFLRIQDNPHLNIYNLYGDCVYPSDVKMAERLFQHLPGPLKERMDAISLKERPEPVLDPPCISSQATTKYLNTDEVRTDLHIPDDVPAWELCTEHSRLNYTDQYDSMATTYQQIHEAGIRGLVYNGDVDMACNFIGDQWFVESLKYDKTSDRRPWYVNGVVGGWVKQFDLLDLLTVRGSGHMVPEDKPAEALHMIKAFIEQTQY